MKQKKNNFKFFTQLFAVIFDDLSRRPMHFVGLFANICQKI